jgi:hypothetical protein
MVRETQYCKRSPVSEPNCANIRVVYIRFELNQGQVSRYDEKRRLRASDNPLIDYDIARHYSSVDRRGYIGIAQISLGHNEHRSQLRDVSFFAFCAYFGALINLARNFDYFPSSCAAHCQRLGVLQR